MIANAFSPRLANTMSSMVKSIKIFLLLNLISSRKEILNGFKNRMEMLMVITSFWIRKRFKRKFQQLT